MTIDPLLYERFVEAAEYGQMRVGISSQGHRVPRFQFQTSPKLQSALPAVSTPMHSPEAPTSNTPRRVAID
jgi:hypothetical protein